MVNVSRLNVVKVKYYKEMNVYQVYNLVVQNGVIHVHHKNLNHNQSLSLSLSLSQNLEMGMRVEKKIKMVTVRAVMKKAIVQTAKSKQKRNYRTGRRNGRHNDTKRSNESNSPLLVVAIVVL
jgi:hypothetical protein